MKNSQKVIALAVTALVALSLTGCSAFIRGVQEGAKQSTSRGQSADVAVPDVLGTTGSEALGQMLSAGLAASFEDSDGSPLTSDEAADLDVTYTDPSVGTKVSKGKIVTVHVAKPVKSASGASADDPAAVGSTIQSSFSDGSKYEVTFGAVTWNANAAIAAENQFNDAAPAGQQYALVPATFKNTGTTEVSPGVEAYSYSYVDSAGTAHSFTESYAVIPNSLSGSSVPPGATVAGNFVILVPAGTTGGGVFAIKGTPYYFVAAS